MTEKKIEFEVKKKKKKKTTASKHSPMRLDDLFNVIVEYDMLEKITALYNIVDVLLIRLPYRKQ